MIGFVVQGHILETFTLVLYGSIKKLYQVQKLSIAYKVPKRL